MKKITQLLIALCCALNLHAATSITTPTVSGYWTLAGSPYKIYNNIKITLGSVLYIEPGVEVEFQGPYSLTVDGTLSATGTGTLPILFHIDDTTGWSTPVDTAGKWLGIMFKNHYSFDTSKLEYVNISDCNCVSFDNCNAFMSRCGFFHNKYSGRIFTIGNIDSVHEVQFVNSAFHDNLAGFFVLGGYCSPGSGIDSSGWIKFINCSIHDNNSGGNVFLFDNTKVGFVNNIFCRNKQTDTFSSGGTICGIYNSKKSFFYNNKLYDNVSTDAAVLSLEMTNADVFGNLICNNLTMSNDSSAPCAITNGGGGLRLGGIGYYRVYNNIVANNRSNYAGGGIYANGGAYIDIINNTIVNNSSPAGGGIYSLGNKLRIINNVFYNNISDNRIGMDTANLWLPTVDTITYHHNWTQRKLYKDRHVWKWYVVLGDTSTNVIGLTPFFVAPTLTTNVSEHALTANFNLTSGSPCLNKGDNAILIPGIGDYAGNARVHNGIVDIGAYEYGAWPLGTIEPNETSAVIKLYPNPATNTLSITTPEAKGTLQLLDLTGRHVAEKIIENATTTFDIHDLPRGIYLAVWNGGNNERVVEKVVLE